MTGVHKKGMASSMGSGTNLLGERDDRLDGPGSDLTSSLVLYAHGKRRAKA